MMVTRFGPWMRTAGACVSCAVLGWVLGVHSATPIVPEPAVVAARSPAADSMSLLDVRSVGSVTPDASETHRGDRRSGSAEIVEIVEMQAGQPPACPEAPAPMARTDDMTGRVLRGTEGERYDTLMQAQADGGISESVVKTLFETDASPRVRLLAFEFALQAHSGDPAGLRGVLEAARLLPDAVISGDARDRLEALGRAERDQADVQQIAP